jgi:hypothetical protein
MIWPNLPAADYQHRLDIATSQSQRSATLPAMSIHVDSWVTYGVPYSGSLPEKSGIYIRARIYATLGSSTIHYEVVLNSPWGDFTKTGTLAAWPSSSDPFEVRLELDDVTLSVPNCDSWTYASGDLRLYIENVLEYTITGPLGDSGTGYDRRENTFDVRQTALAGGLPASCDATTTTDYLRGSTTAGYRYDRGSGWMYDPIVIDNTITWPYTEDLSCNPTTCPGDHDRILVPGSNQSWSVVLPFQHLDAIRRTYLGNFCCDCNGGPSCTVQQACYDVHSIEHEYDRRVTACKLDPATMGIFEHERETCADTFCSGLTTPTCDTVTSTEPYTYARVRHDVRSEDTRTCCYTITQPGICSPPCAPLGGSDCAAGVCEDTDCVWEGSFQISFPTKPNCDESAVSYDVSDSRRHFVAYLEGGALKIGRAANAVPLVLDVVAPGVSGITSLCLRVDRRSREERLHLYTEEASVVKHRQSDDDGATFGAPTTIASGATPTALITEEGVRFEYWRDGSAIKGRIVGRDGTVLVATFTAVSSGVDAAPLHVERRRSVSGGWVLRLYYTSGGSLVVRESSDGQTWGSSTIVATGSAPAMVYPGERVIYEYWRDGGAIKGRVLDNAGTVIQGPSTCVASVDAVPFAADESVGVDDSVSGRRRVVLWYVVGGVLTQVRSYDGLTFA